MLIGLEPLPALTVLSLSISITLHHSMNQNFNLEMSSIIFSGGVDWPPNVMASEGLDGATPASHPPTPPTAGTPTSAGAGLLMLTHNTALSITLVIGVFFLALNLLIFGAIYRQRVQHRASRRRAHHHQLQQQASSRRDAELVESSVTDLRHYSHSNSNSCEASVKSRTSFIVETPVASVNGVDFVGVFAQATAAAPAASNAAATVDEHPPTQGFSDNGQTGKWPHRPPSPPLVYRQPFPHLPHQHHPPPNQTVHCVWPAAPAAAAAVMKAQEVQEINV